MQACNGNGGQGRQSSLPNTATLTDNASCQQLPLAAVVNGSPLRVHTHTCRAAFASFRSPPTTSMLAISHSHQPPVSTAALLCCFLTQQSQLHCHCHRCLLQCYQRYASPMDAPTTSSSPFPGTSFVILSVSIVGILATSLLLLAYYLFLTRCGLPFFWRPGGMRDDDGVLAGHRHVIVTVHEPAPPRRSGLEDAAIRRIPTLRYRHGHLMLAVAEANQKQAAAECAVCLADFRDGERLRVLPPCLHAFHIDCIDAWLQSAATCPLCRAAVSDPAALHYHHLDVPTPVPRAATDDTVIDVIGTTISPSAAADDEVPAAAPSRETAHRNNCCSMGGGGGGDGCFLPMRRSLSMDSSTDKRFYLALQTILRQTSPALTQDEEGKAESSNAAANTGPPSSRSRRLRRSFFSFSQSRGSRSAVLPL